MAHEVELKFHIPPQRLAALRRAVATATAERIALAAVYVDTPAQDLARARGALRLRREGEAWVQTLKAEGRGPLERLEHEVTLAPGVPPVIDPARHAGTPAGDWLARTLAGAAAPPLVERYATRVERTRRLVRSGGALLELALDEGELSAADGARRLPVCELEIELKRGEPAALLALAARWAERFGLLLDSRSKSERGHALAEGLAASPPVRARTPTLADALRQALGNASVLAEGASGSGTAGHREGLREGLRRLRAVLAADDARQPALQALADAAATDAAAALAACLATRATQRLWLALLADSVAPPRG